MGYLFIVFFFKEELLRIVKFFRSLPCCGKTQNFVVDKSYLRKCLFSPAYSSRVDPSWCRRARREEWCSWLCCMHRQEGESNKGLHSFHFLIYAGGNQSHSMVPPTFRFGQTNSFNLENPWQSCLEICLHGDFKSHQVDNQHKPLYKPWKTNNEQKTLETVNWTLLSKASQTRKVMWSWLYDVLKESNYDCRKQISGCQEKVEARSK